MASSFDTAIPFYPGDMKLACRMMQWVVELETPKAERAILIPSATCTPRDIYLVYRAASECFSEVLVDVCELPDAAWPVGPNRLFEWAGNRLRRPFLWLEPDCVPLHKDWLSELDEEYKSSAKPILADWYDNQHTSGIAVYAPAEARLLSATGDQKQAWDSREPGLFRSLSQPTRKIQHCWGVQNVPPTFDPSKTSKEGATTISFIRHGAGIFHRCKDASLMRVLRPVFNASVRLNVSLQKRCFVQLGRYGDIINLLPVLRDLNAHGMRHDVVVSEQFADVFDGVTYASAIPVACGPYDLQEGLRVAKERFKDVVVTQVYGNDWQHERKTNHFNKDSWNLAGYLDRWSDQSLRLVFDRRDYRRELKLRESVWPKSGKPVILLNTGPGFSFRFQHGSELDQKIMESFGDNVEFIDVGKIRSQRVYDLVGLMELADGMVTIDTATLHIATAASLPVVAILPSKDQWLGAEFRGANALTVLDCDLESRIGEVVSSISSMADIGRVKVVHVFESHGELNARESAAQSTWNRTGWALRPYDRYARDARSIGDTRDLPFFKDILAHGLVGCDPWDIVVFTNSDIALRDGIDAEVRKLMRSVSVCTARRMDHDKGSNSAPYAGRDLVAFRAGWLRHHFQEIPDFLIGASHWDLWAMAQARVMAANQKVDFRHLHADSPECELSLGACLHQKHKSRWLDNESSPSELHNRSLYRAYMKSIPS
jgi:hypothetical protein